MLSGLFSLKDTIVAAPHSIDKAVAISWFCWSNRENRRGETHAKAPADHGRPLVFDLLCFSKPVHAISLALSFDLLRRIGFGRLVETCPALLRIECPAG